MQEVLLPVVYTELGDDDGDDVVVLALVEVVEEIEHRAGEVFRRDGSGMRCQASKEIKKK